MMHYWVDEYWPLRSSMVESGLDLNCAYLRRFLDKHAPTAFARELKQAIESRTGAPLPESLNEINWPQRVADTIL